MKNIFEKYKIYLLHIIILAAVAYAYVPEVLSGKTIVQSDVVQYKGMATEILEYDKVEGEGPLWTNSQFGGMPSYQISMKGHDNPVKKLMKPSFHHPFNKIFIAMVCAYIMFLAFGVSHWLALIGAFAIAFSTNNLIILEAGHNTKMQAIAYAPLVIAGLKLLLKKRWLLGINILAVGTALEVASNHIQITYYVAIIVVIWMIAELYKAITAGELKTYFKAAGIAAVIAVLALAINSQNMLLSQEYAKTTIRGKSDLTMSKVKAVENENKAKDGLDYDYAYQWSNGWADVMALIIPNYAGSGSSVDLGSGSVLEDIGLPKDALEKYPFAYWGSLPFTAGPVYFGASMFLLFIVGFIFSKGPIKWWILVAFILSIAMSMGKNNFVWLNDFLFNNLPMYNKFRAPTMALTIAQICLPILAIVGLSQFLEEEKDSKEVLKKLKIAGISVGAFLVILTFMSGMFTDFGHYIEDPATGQIVKDYDKEVYDQYKIEPGYQIDARKELIKKDGLRSLFFVGAIFLLLWFYTKNKIQKQYVLLGIAFCIVVDLWTVDKRFLNNDDFQKKRKVENYVAPTQIDLDIMKDKSYYRVLDLQGNPMSNARTSYFHKSIGGYHAAKLRRYQELYDWHIQDDMVANNLFGSNALNMLNTKYIIGQGQDNKASYQQNPNALGNVWFVQNVEMVENADSAILGLKKINPATTTVVESKYEESISSTSIAYDSSATISLTSYHPEKMTYTSNSSEDGIAIFSEIYYPYGWNAYIDNEKVDYFCANYIIRGLSVPKGKHDIEFRFEPEAYSKGKTIMMTGNAILYLMLIGSLGFWIFSILKTKNAE
jgi:hypothetical protein